MIVFVMRADDLMELVSGSFLNLVMFVIGNNSERQAMEVFVDFGLFELLAATGLVLTAKTIYTRAYLAFTCLIISVLAPIAMVFFVHEGFVRWLAGLSLATALINVSLIFFTHSAMEYVDPLG